MVKIDAEWDGEEDFADDPHGHQGASGGGRVSGEPEPFAKAGVRWLPWGWMSPPLKRPSAGGMAGC